MRGGLARFIAGRFSLLDISFGGGGLLKGERVIAALRALVGEMHIENLPIRFTAVAADIVRGREVWIDQGPFDAIRASISLPLFFTPAEHQGLAGGHGRVRSRAHRADLPRWTGPDGRRQSEWHL